MVKPIPEPKYSSPASITGSVFPSKILENGVLAPKSTAASMANETPVRDVARFILVVMAFSSGTARYLHYAVHIIRLAARNLNLNSAVTNSELMLQLFCDCAKHILAPAYTLFLDTDVAATTNHSRSNCPDMRAERICGTVLGFSNF